MQGSPDCLSLSSLHHLQPAPTNLAAAGGRHHHHEAVLSGVDGQASHQAQLAMFGADQYFVSGKGFTISSRNNLNYLQLE